MLNCAHSLLSLPLPWPRGPHMIRSDGATNYPHAPMPTCPTARPPGGPSAQGNSGATVQHPPGCRARTTVLTSDASAFPPVPSRHPRAVPCGRGRCSSAGECRGRGAQRELRRGRPANIQQLRTTLPPKQRLSAGHGYSPGAPSPPLTGKLRSLACAA